MVQRSAYMVQTFRNPLEGSRGGGGGACVKPRSPRLSFRAVCPSPVSPFLCVSLTSAPFVCMDLTFQRGERMARMRMQLVCAMLLLAFASCSLCSDSEEEMKALEADLLTNMYTSKINKAKVPQWKTTLLNICDLITNISNQEEEAGETEDEDFVTRRQFPATLDGFSLEAMLTLYQLQKVCHSRTFQQWELLQQDIYEPENSSQDKDLMKRKTPYILKRQLHVNKARRPYILKRSSYY